MHKHGHLQLKGSAERPIVVNDDEDGDVHDIMVISSDSEPDIVLLACSSRIYHITSKHRDSPLITKNGVQVRPLDLSPSDLVWWMNVFLNHIITKFSTLARKGMQVMEYMTFPMLAKSWMSKNGSYLL